MASPGVIAGAFALAAAGATAWAADEVAASAAAEVPSSAGVFALAVLQGLTEFLPISSSGHLAVGKELMDLHEGGLALDVALHVGTLVAIIAAFRRDVLRLFGDLLQGRLAMWIWLIVATVPVGVIGILFKDRVEAASASFIAVAPGFFVTSIWLILGERARRRSDAEGRAPEAHAAPGEAPPLKEALLLGCAQAVAIWPGVSRSGSTISAGLLRGISAQEAARLSFLMSLPAISGAAIVELPDALDEGFGGIDPGIVLAAAAVAGVVGFLALKTLLLVLRKGSFPWFAGYCAALGALVLFLSR